MNGQAQLPINYEYKSFVLADGEVDYDVKTNIVELFSDILTARSTIIKTTKDITVKLNSTLLDGFPVLIGDGPFQLAANYILVKNIYLSNASGAASTIQIFIFG